MGWLLLGLIAAAMLAASVRPRPPVVAGRRAAAGPPPSPSRPTGTRRRGPVTDGPDPFEVLRIQVRLGALAEEVRAIESSGEVYARMHHWTATQAAYDALLVEACVLAGIAMTARADARPTVRQGEQERFREEVELAARGWSW